MERTVWSDERLDERFDRIEVRLDRIERELHAGFTTIRRDMFHGAIALFGSHAALLAVPIARSF